MTERSVEALTSSAPVLTHYWHDMPHRQGDQYVDENSREGEPNGSAGIDLRLRNRLQSATDDFSHMRPAEDREREDP